MAKYDQPPTKKLQRAQIVGGVALESGFTRLRYAVRGLAGGDQQALEQQRDEEIARRMFAAMGQLRGTALKISQFLATEQDLVPEAARRELARAAYQAPPLNRAVARRAVQAELGKAPERLFAKFETTPFAAASLGQVHRAIEHGTGRELAVKVQYPGIDESIASDVDLVRVLIRGLRPLSSHRPEFEAIEPALAEVEQRLYEELDYRHEAEVGQWFRANPIHEQVVVPEVVPEFSSRRVLTTELLHGQHLDEWLASGPSKAEVDRRGQIFAELFFSSMFHVRRIHTDPNPGNYLLLPDGRIGLIDFGCTDEVSLAVASFFGLCMRAYMVGDLDGVIAQYQRFGLLETDMDAATRADIHGRLECSREWVALTLGPQRVDFGACQEILSKMREAAMALSPAFKRSMPGVMFVTRAFVGLFRTLRAMKAEVELNRLVPDVEFFRAMQDQAEVSR
ncbi:ABC1 kinase family protein [Enhygromyxa salina]|uniref:ABC1 kinase family protein n=1 Tax=Enhygromyxa salina TaxID=215803 RepID=UPI0015E735FA|nr:AarF/ABC1/UbiB kinase family protein [Enhygromyxa salina]